MILDEFRREIIIARGNSVVPVSQACVSPKLTGTDPIGETVYRRMHYLLLSLKKAIDQADMSLQREM
ncbi:hypothetical protein [Paraburkholderia sp. BL10I2N1]|uniref:hypothetical protein n=1 Tax=Paraburkholderia sp. BL10I2N1 TaxID=1938796 RepID=UPI00105C120E|nr:hypothetical protein [Paraburkholderia sp. BL10I2N1]